MDGMEQRTSIDVAASPDRVWEVLVDVERWPEWTDSVSSVRPLDAGPLAVGSRVEIAQPRIPTGTYTVTALEPGSAFTWEQRQPGSTVSAHHECAPLPDGGTRVELRVVMSGAVGGSWDGCTEGSPSGTSPWRRPASRPVRRASLAERRGSTSPRPRQVALAVRLLARLGGWRGGGGGTRGPRTGFPCPRPAPRPAPPGGGINRRLNRDLSAAGLIFKGIIWGALRRAGEHPRGDANVDRVGLSAVHHRPATTSKPPPDP